jgi:hypothetical protein
MTARRHSDARSLVIRVWALLAGATLVVGWLAEGRHVEPRVALTVALAVAAFKARLVLLHYMELRHAPLGWRLAFEAWALAAAGGILAAYWAAA